MAAEARTGACRANIQITICPLTSIRVLTIRPKTCFTYLGWSFYVIMVSKKQVSKTSIFELPGVKNCISRLCTNPLGDPPPHPCAQYPNRVKTT